MGRERVPSVKVLWQGRDVSASVLAVTVEDDDRLADKAELVYESRDGVRGVRRGPGAVRRARLGGRVGRALPRRDRASERRGDARAGASGRRVTALRPLDEDAPRGQDLPVRRPGKVSRGDRDDRRSPTGRRSARSSASRTPELTPRTPLRQTNQTDLAFLQQLARRYGARAFVEVNDGRPQFYFLPERTMLAAPVAGRMKYCGGTGELRSFEYRRAAVEAPAEVKATAVDAKTAKPATAEAERRRRRAGHASTTRCSPGWRSATRAREGGLQGGGGDGRRRRRRQPDAQVRKGAAVGTPSDPERARLAARRDLTRLLGMTGEGVAVGTIHLRAKSRVELSASRRGRRATGTCGAPSTSTSTRRRAGTSAPAPTDDFEATR